MRVTSRRKAIAFFITLSSCVIAAAVTLNVSWIVLNWRELGTLILGVIFFSIVIAGLVLNTIFLVREIRRNEKQDSFLHAVTHELKTPLTSIRLYLQTLQSRKVDEQQRNEFYRVMLSDSDRLLQTVEQDTDWDTSDFNRYGHLVIESGRRYAHGQAQWAHWAATQVDNLETTKAPVQTR